MLQEYVEGETVEDFLEKVGGKIIEGLARFITQQLIIAVRGRQAAGWETEGLLTTAVPRISSSVRPHVLFVHQVDFCHRRSKLLRDIKLSNILLAISEGQLPLVKLCDFSISKDILRDAHDQSQVCQGLCVC